MLWWACVKVRVQLVGVLSLRHIGPKVECILGLDGQPLTFWAPLPRGQCSPVVIHENALLCGWWQEGLLWGLSTLSPFGASSHCKARADLRLGAVVLLQPSGCWDCRHMPPQPAVMFARDC